MFIGLGCGCLLAMGIGLAPRLFLIIAWIFSDRWDRVWADTSFIWPLLGIIFLPYTTVMYMLVWTATGIAGWDWIWILLGLALDVMKWGQLYNERKGVPGYPSDANGGAPAAATSAPAAQTAAATTAPAATTAAVTAPVDTAEEAPSTAETPADDDGEAPADSSSNGSAEPPKQS